MFALRRSRALLVVALASLLAGCGGQAGKSLVPPVTGPTLPPGTPAADAPDHATTRFFTAYTRGVEAEADTLLASNFRYHFSAQADPTLVALYGENWGKANEAVALHHLFAGFRNSDGVNVPAAGSLTYQLINLQVYDDPAHSDSAAYHKYVPVSNLNPNVDVPSAGGGTTYNISQPIALYLVRGDAAVLGPGQSAASTRWYLYVIDDLAPSFGGLARAARADAPTPAQTTSWGKLRALYL